MNQNGNLSLADVFRMLEIIRVRIASRLAIESRRVFVGLSAPLGGDTPATLGRLVVKVPRFRIDYRHAIERGEAGGEILTLINTTVETILEEARERRALASI